MTIHLHQGDCLEVLKEYPDESFDLIMTSPPYADARPPMRVKPDDYVEWFLPMAAEFKRVLKSTGSFVLNIKEKAKDGERHTYVMELVLALRDHGWLWVEDYPWHKTNSFPGKWPDRFRDGWEHNHHFALTRRRKDGSGFYMDQDAVRVPLGDWAIPRLSNLSPKDHTRDPSAAPGSGFGKNVSNWLEADGTPKKLVYPDNVLQFATVTSNHGISAFPTDLPDHFIRLLCPPGGRVLDPFLGTGTTALVARALGRSCVGVELDAGYLATAVERLSVPSKRTLLDA